MVVMPTGFWKRFSYSVVIAALFYLCQYYYQTSSYSFPFGFSFLLWVIVPYLALAAIMTFASYSLKRGLLAFLIFFVAFGSCLILISSLLDSEFMLFFVQIRFYSLRFLSLLFFAWLFSYIYHRYLSTTSSVVRFIYWGAPLVIGFLFLFWALQTCSFGNDAGCIVKERVAKEGVGICTTYENDLGGLCYREAVKLTNDPNYCVFTGNWQGCLLDTVSSDSFEATIISVQYNDSARRVSEGWDYYPDIARQARNYVSCHALYGADSTALLVCVKKNNPEWCRDVWTALCLLY